MFIYRFFKKKKYFFFSFWETWTTLWYAMYIKKINAANLAIISFTSQETQKSSFINFLQKLYVRTTSASLIYSIISHITMYLTFNNVIVVIIDFLAP